MFATIKKEFLLLIRDPGGLLLLLIMPAVLIIVMATVQDAPFKDYQQMHFEMPVVNKDRGSMGEKIVDALKQSKNFIIIEPSDTHGKSDSALLSAIHRGDYSIGLIIPENTTAVLVSKSNQLSNALARGMGMPGSLPVSAKADSAIIRLIFDPVSKPSFRSAINFAVNQYIVKSQMEILVERLSRSAGDSSLSQSLLQESLQSVYVQEEQAGSGAQTLAHINSVQHNVPAWAIFGMFMIVVPIAGNMIRERDEGSALRLMLIPHAAGKVAFGRILFYIMLCMLQFVLMLMIGIFILPHIGLSALHLGTQPWALLPMAIVIAFTATAYGFFVGSVFHTANQAMSVGAISIVLVSAIGGVWVPVEILPKVMQYIAMVSPLHWALEGINNIMLRDAGFPGIIRPGLILILLGALLTFGGIYFRKN